MCTQPRPLLPSVPLTRYGARFPLPLATNPFGSHPQCLAMLGTTVWFPPLVATADPTLLHDEPLYQEPSLEPLVVRTDAEKRGALALYGALLPLAANAP